MGALSYLLVIQTKNRIVQFLRSPGKVIYALILLLAAVMSFVSADLPLYGNVRDIRELYVILFAFYTFAFINIAKNGFMGAGSLFSLADVNLLFTSPIKNTTILLYAMLQQLGRCVFMGVILLLQFNNVNRYYGVGYGEFLIMILFSALILRGYWIALHGASRFQTVLASGLVSLIAVQVILNLGVVTNLLPSTGIALPFFSYGGTALAVNLAEMGIVLSISRYRNAVAQQEEEI